MALRQGSIHYHQKCSEYIAQTTQESNMSIRITVLFSVLALIIAGCGKPKENFQTVSEADAKKAEENSKKEAASHVHKAPHGGELIEIGDHQYNVELVLADGSLTAYVLGGHAEESIAIKQKTLVFDIEDDEGGEVGIKLEADPQEGDDDGLSSRFVAKADAVPDTLKSLEDVHGHVHINIFDKEFVGELDHDEEGHDHDNEDKGHDDDKGHKDGDKDGDKDHKEGDKDGDKASDKSDEKK
jgi:hypothetical protein